MATPRPSPCKLMDDSETAVSPPQPSENKQTSDVGDVIEFVEPLPNELQCPVCQEFLKEPTLTSCGHHFCRECIVRSIARSHVCPMCNEEGFQTFLNKEKQRVISTLKIYCRRKSQGCDWVGELGRLEHHLDVEEGDCGCVEVECEFGPVGCVAKLPRKDLQRHKEENVHKHLVLMSVMSLKSNEALVKELREQRVEFQQQLKQKDEEIQAIQKSLQHLIEEKNEQLKVLQGQMEANEKRLDDVERKQQEEKQEMSRRLGQADTSLGDSQGQVKEVKELIQKLEQGCSETAEEIMGRLGQVESSLEESKTLVEQMNDRVQKLEKHTFIPPPDFTMTDFEKHKKDGDIWYSPPFCSHTGGYKMRLRVYANGLNEGKGTHVSLSVHLMRGEHDNCLKWPFLGRITVQLLNQKCEGQNVKRLFYFDDRVADEAGGRVIECEEATMGFGYTKCIAHNDLGYNWAMNTEYLRNDCLKFRVTNIKLTDL